MTRPIGVENRTTKKSTQTPTSLDIAWAAGFIEGEGCFSSNGSTNKIAVCQKQKEPLERLLKFFGGSLSWQNVKGVWEWRVFGARARGIIFTIYSFMSPRRKLQINASLVSMANTGDF